MIKIILILIFACSYMAYQRYVLNADSNQQLENPMTMIVKGVSSELSGKRANNYDDSGKFDKWIGQVSTYENQTWIEGYNPFSQLAAGMAAELGGNDVEALKDNQEVSEWLEKVRLYSREFSDVVAKSNQALGVNNSGQWSTSGTAEAEQPGEYNEPGATLDFSDFQEKLNDLIKEQAEILSGSRQTQ